MDNMKLYNEVKSVPSDALKKITAGRLKGMSSINPQWRIKVLTEKFGACGFGWKTDIVQIWNVEGANGENVTNVRINLYVQADGEWSEPIPGIGGSKFVAKESNGLYTDDEAFKKAYTDAISVACKALGIGADVYYSVDDSNKYDILTDKISEEQKAALDALGIDINNVATYYKTTVDKLTSREIQNAIDLKRSRK